MSAAVLAEPNDFAAEGLQRLWSILDVSSADGWSWRVELCGDFLQVSLIDLSGAGKLGPFMDMGRLISVALDRLERSSRLRLFVTIHGMGDRQRRQFTVVVDQS